MLVKFIGFETVDYTNKAGARVTGVRGYYATEIKNGTGHKCNTVFFHPDRFNLPALPSTGAYNIEWGCTAGGSAYLVDIKNA